MRVFHEETVTAALEPVGRPPLVSVRTASGGHTLALPHSLGGKSVAGATNPEQLFGSAYAGCMIFALEHAARRAGLDGAALDGVSVQAEVRIGRATDNTNRLAVDLAVHLPALDGAAADELTRAALRFCPFHQALEHEVASTMVVTGGPDRP